MQQDITPEILLNLFQRCDGGNQNVDDRRLATTQLTAARKGNNFMQSVLLIYEKAENENLKLLAVLELKNNVKKYFGSLVTNRIKNMQENPQFTEEQNQVLSRIIQAWVKDDTKRRIHLVQCMATVIGIQIRAKVNEPRQILQATYKSLQEEAFVMKGLELSASVFDAIKTFFWCLNLRKHKQLIQMLIEIWKLLVKIQTMALQHAQSDPDASVEPLRNCTICFMKIWAVKKYDVGSIADGLFEQVMQNTMQYLQLYGGNIKKLSPKTQDTFEKSLDLLQKSLSETVRKVDEEFNNYRKPFLDICIKFVQDPSHPYGMTKFAFLTLGVLLRYTQAQWGPKLYKVVPAGGAPVRVDAVNDVLQNDVLLSQGDEVLVTDAIHGQNEVKITHQKSGVVGWMQIKRMEIDVPFIGLKDLYLDQMDSTIILEKIKKSEKPISPQEASELMMLILNKYLTNITQDWSNDPEMFFQDTLNDVRIHQGANTFLGSLISEFRSDLVPVLVNALGQTMQEDPSKLEVALRLDVIYNALGIFIASRCLKNSLEGLPADQFIENCLKRDLNSPHRFLLRRVIWLFGKMRYIIVSAKYHKVCLQLLAQQFRHDDLVIRLTTVKSICDISFMIAGTEYVDQVSSVFPQIVNLFGHVEDVRNIAFIVDSARRYMKKIMPELSTKDMGEVLQLAISMWSQFNQSMVRVAMINLIAQIASAMRTKVLDHENFFLQVLDFSTDFSNEKSNWVWESGLDLWHTYLYNIPKMSQNVQQRFERWEKCMGTLVFQDESIEWIKKGMKIFHSYMLLDKSLILQRHEQVDGTIAKCLDSCEKNVNIHYIRLELNYLISIVPNEAPQLLQRTLQVALLKILDTNIPVETIRYYISIYSQLFLYNFDGAKNLFAANGAKQFLLPFLRRWADILPRLLGGSNGRVDYRVSCLTLARMIANINDDLLNRNVYKAFSSIQDRHIQVFKIFKPPPVPQLSKGTELERNNHLSSLKKGSSVEVLQSVKEAIQILRQRLGMNESSI